MPVSTVPPAQQFEELWRRAAPHLGGMSKQEFLGKMATWVKNPHNKIFSFGRSSFLISVKSPGVIEFHTLGADSPRDLVRDAKGAVQAMKKVGAKHLYSFTTDPRLIEMVKATGLPFKVTQSQSMVGNQMQPAYRIDLDL